MKSVIMRDQMDRDVHVVLRNIAIYNEQDLGPSKGGTFIEMVGGSTHIFDTRFTDFLKLINDDEELNVPEPPPTANIHAKKEIDVSAHNKMESWENFVLRCWEGRCSCDYRFDAPTKDEISSLHFEHIESIKRGEKE